MELPLPSWQRCPSLYICVVVFLHRFLAISAIFRHTYVDITPTEGLSVPAYQRHVLICKASFRGEAPDIEWFKAPGRIRLDNNPRFTVQMTYNAYETVVSSRLIFKNALPGDSGTYLCEIVSSGVGVSQVPVRFWTDDTASDPSTTTLTAESTCTTADACNEENEISQYAKTKRSKKPEPVLTPDPDKTLIPGDEHMLTCTVQGGFEGSMLWSKDGYFIGTEGNFDTDGDYVPDVRILPQSHSIVILNAEANDAGVYSCRFRYNYGRQWKSIAGSVNLYAGVALRSDSYVLWQGNQTSPLRVQCTATGYPLPIVSWTYTTKKIDIRTGSWNNTIAIWDTQVSQIFSSLWSVFDSPSCAAVVQQMGYNTAYDYLNENKILTQSTMTISRMPGFFNITKFYCKGENRISSKINTIMIVNVGTRLLPGRAASTSSCNVMLLTLAICTSELLRRNMR